MEKVDIAVVFYEKEAALLGLLVRSIELYCPSDLIDKLYFINNSIDSDLGRKCFERDVLPNFDKFSSRVKLISASDLGVDVESNFDPYIAQQALKLEFHKVTDKSHYLVLDAKNHFIRALTQSDLFSNEGKPVSHHQVHRGYPGTLLANSCNYFDVEVAQAQPVLPMVTPYLMITQIAGKVCKHIEEKEGIDVYAFIEKKGKVSEFMLYCAFILANGGIENTYSIKPKPYATLFTKWPESESDIKQVLQSTGKEHIVTFAIHINRFQQLTHDHINFITQMWVERNLFDSIEAGKAFINDQVSGVKGNAPQSMAKGDGKVVVGDGGRLFIANDSNNVIGQHQGKRLLTDKQVKTWRYLLEVRKALCGSKGISYHFLVVPDAHAVYREQLPMLKNTESTRPVKQLLDAVVDYSYLTYPLDELINSKDSGEPYHPADSHYTSFGAYICYREVINRIQKKLFCLSSDEVQLVPKNGTGDLGEKFEPVRTADFTECVVKQPKAKKVWTNNVVNKGQMSVWINEDKTKPTCLLFTDSYGWKIQPFLAETFSTLYIVHSPLVEIEAIDTFNPNFVLTVMAERFLIYPPDDLFHKTAQEFAAEKVGKVKSYTEIKALAMDKHRSL